MNTPIEILNNIKPLRRKHRVSWGDCDPAGIIYAPRVLEYAIETFEIWNKEILGVPWVKMNQELHLGFPSLRVEIDFVSAPTADDEVILELKVDKMGTKSLTYTVTGHDGDGGTYFHVKAIACMVTYPDIQSTEITDDFRQRILAYQAACQDNT